MHNESLKAHSDNLCRVYDEIGMEGDVIWNDFVTELMPHTVKARSRVQMMNRYRTLKTRSIFLEEGRTFHKEQCIINVLSREKYQPTELLPQTRDRDKEDNLKIVTSSFHSDRRHVFSNKSPIKVEEEHVAQNKTA